MRSPLEPSSDLQRRRYYCRGCGGQLPSGVRAHFHKECLRSDKRERVREQRLREEKRFKARLLKECCPKCGTRYIDQRPEGATEASCEASQATQEGHPPVG